MEGLQPVRADAWKRLLFALCGAAALASLGEIFLGRLAAPGLAFDGGHGALSSLGNAAELAGGRAAAAAAVLVLLASVFLAATLAQRSSVMVGAIAVGAAASLLLVATGGVAGSFGLMAAVLVLLALALRHARWAAALASIALLARQAPLAADAASSPLAPSQLSAVTAVGELALLAVVPTLVFGLIRRARPSGTEWSLAALVAALVAFALIASPTRIPLIAFGSLEMTMVMPLPLYALAAGALGLLLARELRGQAPPVHSIALALLLVASVQPLILHHSIAGLIAVSLLIDTTLGVGSAESASGALARRSNPEKTAFTAAIQKG